MDELVAVEASQIHPDSKLGYDNLSKAATKKFDSLLSFLKRGGRGQVDLRSTPSIPPDWLAIQKSQGDRTEEFLDSFDQAEVESEPLYSNEVSSARHIHENSAHR